MSLQVAALGRLMIVAGLLLAALGAVLVLGRWLPWLGRLPGDIRIERPGFTLYVPLASCLLVSVALSALLWLLGRIFRGW